MPQRLFVQKSKCNQGAIFFFLRLAWYQILLKKKYKATEAQEGGLKKKPIHANYNILLS